MPNIQSTFNDRMRAGRAGLVVNMESQNSVTRISEEANGLGFGLPVVQGVGDKGILLPGSLAYEAAASARAGNTGNGTITAAPAAGAGVQEGTYTLVAEEAPAADGGTFRMEDPEGRYLGTVKVGVAATLGGLGPITIADGATDFVAGDTFEIEVTAEEGGTFFRGITIEDKTLVRREGEAVDTFRVGDNVGLLTAGVIWVVAGAAVRSGAPATFDTDTGRFTEDGDFQIPNAVFDTSAAVNGDLVQLRISAL